MPHIGGDVDAQPAVRGDTLVETSIKRRDKRLEVRPLASWSKSDAGLEPVRRHGLEAIEADVHPGTIEPLLNGGDDAGFAGTRHSVQHNDAAERLIERHAFR